MTAGERDEAMRLGRQAERDELLADLRRAVRGYPVGSIMRRGVEDAIAVVKRRGAP